MNPRTRSRMPASIGSNQASPANSAGPSACVLVLSCSMAWSPPALQRRKWLVATNRRLRHQPISTTCPTAPSLEQSSVCVVDAKGQIVCEAKVASEPEALVRFFDRVGVCVTRIGLEAGPLSQWLHTGLTEAGFEVVLLETRHVKAALSAMTVKTDRKDARGIAQLLRM